MAAPPAAAQSVQQVSGTLFVGIPAGLTGQARVRDAKHPAYVSPATGHAALFIDHAPYPAGETTSCTPTTYGTGAGCTISWSAGLNLFTGHTFSIEIDTGEGVAPTYTVLAQGQKDYIVNGGVNTFGTGAPGTANGPIALNGVASRYAFTSSSCTMSACTGALYAEDPASYVVAYNGSLAPSDVLDPTSGNVFDNDGGGSTPITVTTSNASIATISTTAQAPYVSLANNTLSLLAPTASGAFPYTVTCGGSTSGSFAIDVTRGTTSSGVVTSTELANLKPAVSYPTIAATSAITNIFSCNGTTISNASGTAVAN